MAKTKHLSLNVLAFGLMLGTLTAICMLFLGVGAWQFELWPQTTRLVSEWYIGFQPSGVGVLVGILYGFIDGFVGGTLLAWLYNTFSKSSFCK